MEKNTGIRRVSGVGLFGTPTQEQGTVPFTEGLGTTAISGYY